ncbi:hypothetical protein EYR36_003330 [Pleurotus pulmonarius]|nr:hypothetical protein EYR36_003330 [Pleurotus pulmonarius]
MLILPDVHQDIDGYCTRFPRDRIFLKIVAWTSFIGSLSLTVALFSDMWGKVTKFPGGWYNMTPLTQAAHVLIAILGLNTQGFFAWRIFELCQKRWLLGITCCLSVGAFVPLILVNISSVVTDDTELSIGAIATPAWMVLSISSDLIITISMIILLFKALKEAIFRKTRRTLSNILKFTLETGLITTVLILVQLIFMLRGINATSTNGKHVEGLRLRYIFFYPTGIVYSSWLLASLNARSSMVDSGTLVISSISGLQSTPARDIPHGISAIQQPQAVTNSTDTPKPEV